MKECLDICILEAKASMCTNVLYAGSVRMDVPQIHACSSDKWEDGRDIEGCMRVKILKYIFYM